MKMFRLAFIRSVARHPSISRCSVSTTTINPTGPVKFPLNRVLMGNEIPTLQIQHSGYCTQAPKSKQPEANPPAVDHVGRLDLRIGKIVDIKVAPDADELYLAKVDIGDEILSIVAGLAKFVPSNELLEKNVVVLCNLKRTEIRGHHSIGMIMYAKVNEQIEILQPPADAVPGDLVYCEGYDRVPVEVPRHKKRLFNPLAPDLVTNNKSVACYKGSSLYLVGKGPISAKSLRNAHISPRKLYMEDEQVTNKKPKKPNVNPQETAEIVDIKVAPEADAPKSKQPIANPPAVDHVGRLDLRIGKIVDIKVAPDSDGLYLAEVDIGDEVLSIVALLGKLIPSSELLERNVVVLCNLRRTKVRGHHSQGMIMCAKGSERTEILQPPAYSVPGDLVYCEGYDRVPVKALRHKQKLFNPLAPDLLTNDKSVACYKGSRLYLVGKGPISAKSLRNAHIS